MEDLASKFPSIIQGFDNTGEAIINAHRMEEVLTEARKAAA